MQKGIKLLSYSLILIVLVICCKNVTTSNDKTLINNNILSQIDSLILASEIDSADVLLNNYNESELIKSKDSLQVYYHLLKGRILKRKQFYDLSINSLNKADSLAKSFSLYDYQIDTKVHLVNSYSRLMELESALKEGQKGIEIAKKYRPKRVSELYESLGRVYFYLESASPKSMELLQMALDNMIEPIDSSQIMRIKHKMSTILFAQNEIGIAESYLNEVIAYQEANKQLYELSFSYNTLGNVWAKKGNYRKSLDYYHLVKQLNKRLNMSMATSYQNIGATYHEWGKCDSAIYYYKRSISTIMRTNKNGKLTSQLKDIYKGLTGIYIEQDNYEEALNQFRNYMAYREYDYKRKLHNKIFELEEKYQAKDKQTQIEVFVKQIEEEKRKNSFLIKVIVGLLLFIVLMFIVMRIYYRNKINK